MPGKGLHEVIVESPSHTATFSELTVEQAYWACVAYRDRLRAIADEGTLAHGLIFKNCRGAGGATLEHTHSQLIATTIVPPVIESELAAAKQFSDRRGGACLFCSMAADERLAESRVVLETGRFLVFCPYASRFPYETWILPVHNARFESANLAEIEELSGLLRKVIWALEKIIPQAPYNYWIHSSPFDTASYDHYHWHLELISRSTTQAGFEWGSGCFVNPISPENAAAAFRAVWE